MTPENDYAPQGATEEQRSAAANLASAASALAAATGSVRDGNPASESELQHGDGHVPGTNGDGLSGAAGSAAAQGAGGDAAGQTNGLKAQGEGQEGALTDEVIEPGLDPDELEDLNSQLDAARVDARTPGPLPPSVNARDPLEAMAQLPVEPTADYVNWLEGLVAHYRHYVTGLRAICRRAGHATEDLPYYPEFKG